jgi:deoxyhypusine synthase
MKKVKDIHSLTDFLKNIEYVGFQATKIGVAKKILKKMEKSYNILAFTANLLATGIRGVIIDIIKTGKFKMIITTGGSIDHDIIRAFDDYYIGNFEMSDKLLHRKGYNRLGNVIIKNSSYELLENITKKVIPEGKYTPSQIAKMYGEYLYKNNKESFLAEAYKRNIPVFCPGIVDAAIGLNFYFMNISIDPIPDLKNMINIINQQDKTGALIIGGGISKHHTIGANILRGGLDYSIYISTATEYDGSLSGAKTNEAISWGKINEKARHVNIYGEASIVLPLLFYDR